jgi:hypothetical protein
MDVADGGRRGRTDERKRGDVTPAAVARLGIVLTWRARKNATASEKIAQRTSFPPIIPMRMQVLARCCAPPS